MKKALYAKKIGMTQICDENGIIHSVTVLEGLKSKVITKKDSRSRWLQLSCYRFW